MTVVTSRDNQKLKFARRVRDGKEPAYIFVEGMRASAESVRSDIEIVEVFASESALHKLEMTGYSGAPVVIADGIFNSIADTKSSQGVIVIAERPVAQIDAIRRGVESAIVPIIIFLNEINNPSNLGAILRTAEAAGSAGVLVSKGSADAFSPKALRAAMGASLRVPVVENADLTETLAWADRYKFIPTAADINGRKDYTEIDWKRPRLLVFGSEAHGLEDAEREEIRETIYIPMGNGVESLNLAVSCGIVLYEARRQMDLGLRKE